MLLLEAGPPDRYPWIHIPIGYAKTMFHPVYNWCFKTEPDSEMNGREIYWPRGRTLGGSSAINGLIYIRGQREDYDHWAALGNPGWSYDDVLPYFRKLEHNVRGANRMARRGRPAVGVRHRRQARADRGGDRRRRRDRHSAQRRLQRRDAGRSRLLPAHDPQRPALLDGYRVPATGERAAKPAVETSAHATRILFSERKASGVVYRQAGRDVTVNAAREVILAAGALQSPQLLQLSGVGPPALLLAFGIPVVHPLAGVGENLQDHLQARVIFRCTQADHDQRHPHVALAHAWRWACSSPLARSGPMAVGINQGGIFARTDPASTRPDVQFHVATLSSDMAGSKVHTFSGFTMSVCQLQPESRGYVRIKSPDPLAAPAMQPNYLSTPKDQATLVAGIRLARALAATRALSPYVDGEYRPGPELKSDDALLEFAQEHRRHDLSSVRHLQDGTGVGPAGSRRSRSRSARPRRDSRRRLQHHADARVGQHQRAGR